MTWTAGKTYYLLLDDENSITGTHEFYINCPAALTPKIEYYSSGIDDDSLQSAGDGDGLAEPGEFIQMAIALSNTGTGDAHNVSAVLSSGDADITISDALEDLGDILTGATAEYPSAFVFSVADGSAEKDVTFYPVFSSPRGKGALRISVHIFP